MGKAGKDEKKLAKGGGDAEGAEGVGWMKDSPLALSVCIDHDTPLSGCCWRLHNIVKIYMHGNGVVDIVCTLCKDILCIDGWA